MDRIGNKDIQYELHANYASNFEIRTGGLWGL